MILEFSQKRVSEEIRRLEAEAQRPQPLPGFLSSPFLVTAGSESAQKLKKAQDLLRIVDRQALQTWPTADVWDCLLPIDFKRVFRCPISKAEADEWMAWWRKLSPEKKIEAEEARVWTLENWLHWMKPENRKWHWLASEVIDDRTFRVWLEIDGWPFPWGSFKWLLLGVGCRNIKSEDE